jgi:hypothetical protein
MGDSQVTEWQAAIVEARASGVSRATVSDEYRHRFPPGTPGAAVLLDVARRYPRALVGSAAASVVFFFADPGHHVLLRPFGGGGTGLFSRGAAEARGGIGRMASLVAAAACAAWIVWLTFATVRGLRRAWADAPLREALFTPAVFLLAYFPFLSVFVVLAEGARLRAPILPVVALLAAVSTARPTVVPRDSAHPAV